MRRSFWSSLLYRRGEKLKPFIVPKEYRYLYDRITTELPERKCGIAGVEEHMIEVEVGISLHTYLIFPQKREPSPLILIRNPYSYDIPRLLASVSHFANFGYVVALQSCRGCGKSEGRFVPFLYEKNDGLKTIDYLSRQPWQNGSMGMFGFSYLSFCQYVLADRLPPQIKTMFLDKLGINRYHQMYMNGMFRPEFYTAWVISVTDMDRDLDRASLYRRSLEILPHQNIDVELFGHRIEQYRAVIDHVDQDSGFWEKNIWSDMQNMAEQMPVPVLMCAGWFDHQIKGMLNAYRCLPSHIKKTSRFVIGPWDHLGLVAGDYPFENAEKMGSMGIKAGLEWFDIQLKGKEPAKNYLGVHLYQCGNNSWERFESLPYGSEKQVYYLSVEETTSLKEMKDSIGLLSPCLGFKGEISYFYNPDHPVETAGGNCMMAWMFKGYGGSKHGSVLQPSYRNRKDVLTFYSQPLDEDVELFGSVRGVLFVSTDAQDTSFTLKLIEEDEEGRAYNICDGISSLRYRNDAKSAQDYVAGEVEELVLELWDVHWRLKKGKRIRVDISSSNFPAYINHKNTAEPWQKEDRSVIAEQTIYFGEEFPTRVELPIKR